MAAFASCRRSGWVRVLVVILCALFIFATIATPPAYAVGETFALFGAAAVLSSAVAALGFKLSNDSDGIATLNKMVSDFVKEAWALNVLVVGNRINGLIDGMNYIKMALHNGKTYLDERVIAWCQQWLGQNGVYDNKFQPVESYEDGVVYNLTFRSYDDVCSILSSYGFDKTRIDNLISHFNITLPKCYEIGKDTSDRYYFYVYDNFTSTFKSYRGTNKYGTYFAGNFKSVFFSNLLLY